MSSRRGKLTPEEIKTLKGVFKEMDADGSGELSYEEFKEGMDSYYDDEQINFYYYLGGGTKKKGLKLQDFINAIEKVPEDFWSLDDNEAKRIAFNLVDKDHSGKLSYKEFKSFCRALDPDVPKSLIKELFQKGDKDNSGSITYKEYGNLLNDLSK